MNCIERITDRDGRKQIEISLDSDTIAQLQARVRLKRFFQAPFNYVFWWFEQSIARDQDEIERART